MSYTHFTLEERKYLQQLLSENKSFRQIAAILKRSPSTVSREVNRNKSSYKPRKFDNKFWYNHWRAQNLYIRRRREQKRRALVAGSKQWNYVAEKLKLFWSPEQIVNRYLLEHKEKFISFSTIYRYIYRKELEVTVRSLLGCCTCLTICPVAAQAATEG